MERAKERAEADRRTMKSAQERTTTKRRTKFSRKETQEKDRRKKHVEAEAEGNQKRKPKKEIQSMDNKVFNIFAELLEEVPTQNLLSLFENTKRGTYMYLNSARERESPSGNMISLLVLWVSARFHPRRDWSGGRASPNSQKITVFLISLANRIRWMCYFRDEEKSNLSPALESLLLR